MKFRLLFALAALFCLQGMSLELESQGGVTCSFGMGLFADMQDTGNTLDFRYYAARPAMMPGFVRALLTSGVIDDPTTKLQQVKFSMPKSRCTFNSADSKIVACQADQVQVSAQGVTGSGAPVAATKPVYHVDLSTVHVVETYPDGQPVSYYKHYFSLTGSGPTSYVYASLLGCRAQ